MKGAVFIALNDMIEAQYGIDTWEQLLATVKPQCQGIYTSTEDYPDAEINDFVAAISTKLQLETTTVTRIFGDYLFGELNRKYDIFTKLSSNLFDFLQSIETVIHKEVRKLYTNPHLPTLDCKVTNDNEVTMLYYSERKLCFLAEGLILGAANHYKEEIQINHTECMHHGAERCTLKICKITD